MRKVIIFDTETTGKSGPDNRIIELSARVCDLDKAIELENVLMRFKPDTNITAKAQSIHGISMEMLKHEPTIDKKLDELSNLFGDCYLAVAHNGLFFDFPLLDQEFARFGKKLPEFKKFDTMVAGTFATDLGKSPNLGELCFSLDVDYDPTRGHSGDYDTLVLRDAFFNGLKFEWFVVD